MKISPQKSKVMTFEGLGPIRAAFETTIPVF